MINGFLASILNATSAGLIAMLVSSLVITYSLNPIISRLESKSAELRCVALYTICALPYLAFVFLFLWVLSAPTIYTSPYVMGIIHWHHVSDFQALSWHGVLLVGASVLLIYSVSKALYALAGSLRHIRTLTYFAYPANDFFVIPTTSIQSAFTAGLFHPRCYITKQMISELTSDELNIVTAHERSHVIRKHPLKKAIFRLSTFVFPNMGRVQLVSALSLAYEQQADTDASQVAIGKHAVARTILRVATNATKSPEGACSLTGSNVTKRINYLLVGAQTCGWKFAVNILLLLSVLSFITATSVDQIHHLFEIPFSH